MEKAIEIFNVDFGIYSIDKTGSKDFGTWSTTQKRSFWSSLDRIIEDMGDCLHDRGFETVESRIELIKNSLIEIGCVENLGCREVAKMIRRISKG